METVPATFVNGTMDTPNLGLIQDLVILRNRVYKWRARANHAAWVAQSPRMKERYMSDCKPQAVCDKYALVVGIYSRNNSFNDQDPFAKSEIEYTIARLTVLIGVLRNRRIVVEQGQNGFAMGPPDVAAWRREKMSRYSQP
ncbi:MAG: hypothetical protein Q9207_006454 [Kuettlingeria erythrocarpa]